MSVLDIAGVADIDLGGRTVVMTGGTDGMGKVAAEALVAAGANLVVVARPGPKAEESLAALIATGRTSLVRADLSLLSDVARAAEEIVGRCERIDVLLNNAGVMKRQCEVSKDGFEMSMAVNHLAVAALTLRLLNRLKATPGSRIVNVNSAGHAIALGGGEVGVNLGSWRGPQADYEFTMAYSRSKLANLMWGYELARRLSDTGVTVNALHPASVPTSLDRELPQELTAAYHAQFSTTVENGAGPIVRLAVAPDLAEQTGLYFDGLVQAPSSPISYDHALQAVVWDATVDAIGLDA